MLDTEYRVLYTGVMRKPRCTAKSDPGTCLRPATTRIVLTTASGTRIGFRCDDHPVPDCADAQSFTLTPAEKVAS